MSTSFAVIPFAFCMLDLVTASTLNREPLEAGGPSSGALAGTAPGTVHGDSEAQAAKPPLAVDAAMGGTAPTETAVVAMGGMV